MFGRHPRNLYQYGCSCFSFFLSFFFFFFFFFDVVPCGRKKPLTKSIKLNFVAKLKAENQRVDLNLKTSGTTSDRGLYQHTYFYQDTYYESINIKYSGNLSSFFLHHF